MARIRPATLRLWVIFGTVATTAAGTALLITFARLQASLWVWQDGFYLTGDQWFNAARTTVTLVGIVGLGGAAFLAYRKQVSTEATHLLEQSSGLRDRYTTVAEQLGHDSAAIRLAGVYALASLADDWHDFGNDNERQVCVDLLCAYLRTERPNRLPDTALPAPLRGVRRVAGQRLHPSPHSADRDEDREEKNVRNAIVSLIKTRTGVWTDGPWRPCHFDLSGAELADADLTLAELRWPNLTDTNLSRANFTQTHLHGAVLTGANLYGASMVNAILRHSILLDADLTLAELADADLTLAYLAHSKLIGADLSGADLTDADLTDANLTGANLTGANLTGAKLRITYDLSTQWPEDFVPPPSFR
ncbi:UNVERIFIED_ORG: pentapeptide repeat protein [Nocardia globerula]|uniref:Pentapeptide repeat protein n=1 Tax=Nocardia globerula TaxID=1818 RepID=A0A652YHY2_NOCGL